MPEHLHPVLRVFDGSEAVLFVQPVGVVCDQHPTAHFLKVGMLQDGLDQPFTQTVCAVVLVDEDIAEVGEDGVIADDTRDTDLLVPVIDAEHKRVLDGAFRAFTRTCACPVGTFEKIANGIYVQACRVRADGECVAMRFKDLWHGESLS